MDPSAGIDAFAQRAKAIIENAGGRREFFSDGAGIQGEKTSRRLPLRREETRENNLKIQKAWRFF